MKEIVHSGTRFWFLSASPDWSSRVSVTFRKPVNVERTRNSGEVRRLTGETLRIRQEFSSIVGGSDLRDLEDWLAQHRTELVGVPLWALQESARAPRIPVSAELWVAVSCGYDRAEVFEGSVPEWCTEDDTVCPLVVGRLDSRKLVRINPDWARLEVDHSEDAPDLFAVEFSPAQPMPGPRHDPAGRDPFALFPLPFDFAASEAEESLDVDRAEIGFGRETERRADGQPIRGLSAECTPRNPAEVCRLLAFFSERSSAVPFWVADDGSAVSLVSDLPNGALYLPGDFPAILGGDWLAFRDPGELPRFAQVSESNASGIRLSTAPGAMFARATVVSRMALVRFASDRLAVDFDAPGNATFHLDLRGLRPEQEAESGTVPGENIGTGLPRVWLYCLEADGTSERWTSFDSTVRADGYLWKPCRISHGAIEDSVTGFRGPVKLTVGASASPIVKEAMGRRVSGRLRVSVFSAELRGDFGGDVQTVFTGEVDKLALSGVTVSLSCQPWPRLSALRVPRLRVQPGCNHCVFRGGCRLLEADWKWSARISDPGLPGFPFVLGLDSLDGPGAVSGADWFAGGWVDFGLDRVPVRSSGAPSGRALTITLARDPRPFPRAGVLVSLFPGCDGAAETCRDKFHNFENFGGHPFVPTSNPTLVQLSPAFSGGKK